MFYTGVGARKTPDNILVLMKRIAIKMESYNYTLRSGGAKGADSAFEFGAGTLKDIYYANDCTPAAMAIAGNFHPAWDKCGEFAKKLHGRNAFQVLGDNLDTPSQYCICWTPDGCKSHSTRQYFTGGTGTAISIADAYNVPIINLATKIDFDGWTAWTIN